MATAVRVRFPPSAPARHQGLWQVAATLSFFVVSSSGKPSLSPVFPAFTDLGQTGGTKGASNAIRCPFFRSPAQRFPLPPNNPPFRPASSLRGTHLLFSLCSACCCQKTSGECRDTSEPGNMFPSGSQNACLPAFCLAACFIAWRT